MLYRLSYVGVTRGILLCWILFTALSTIDRVLETARSRYQRVTPERAATEHAAGALLVDLRTSEQRSRQGDIPGAVVIERTVLEWRLDPTSMDRIAQATDHDVRIILICDQGYSSSLAAASLHDLGLVNATDVIGGAAAWRAAGLPMMAGR
jgi:rhodanese-related sulfurtransferase